jgi:hypothetical protein
MRGRKSSNAKKESRNLKDKYVIPLVLALYIGLWVFTGTLERAGIAMWGRVNAGFSMFSTPLGTLLLSAGAGIGIIYCVRRRAK